MSTMQMNLKRQKLRLARPNIEHRDSFLAALEEFETEAEKSAWIYLGEKEPLDTPRKDFAAYVEKLISTESTALPGFVKNTAYWAVLDGDVVGRISIRHELNEFLARIGGHIGYIVRPSYRRMGIATEMLRQVLCPVRARSTQFVG